MDYCQAVSHKHHKIDGYANRDDNDYPEYERIFYYFVSNMSKSFKGAHVSSVFGHLTVDLTEIGIKGIAVIDASAVFGTLEIRMPSGIPYQTKVTPVFGSFINRAP